MEGVGYKNIEVSKMQLPPWRWKLVDNIVKTKVSFSLKKFGQIRNIVVRQIGERYEIIDGTEVYHAAKDLGKLELFCYDMGPISDDKAKEVCMSIDLNKNEVDVIKLAKVISSIEMPHSALSSSTPYSEEDLQNLKKLLEFDWGVFIPEEDPTPTLFPM